MSKLWSILFLLLISIDFTVAQKVDFNRLTELINQTVQDDAESETMTEELYELYENPLPINTADSSDFLALFFLNEYQISEILNFRRKYGNIYSAYEFRFLKKLNYTERELLTALTTFAINENERKSYLKQQIILRTNSVLEKQEGYTDNVSENSRFLGSRPKIYAQYKISKKNKFSGGITCEKDAGEYFFAPQNKQGFDFYSFFIQLEKVGRIKKIIVGDFSARFGQGLNIWGGFAGRKGDNVNMIAKYNQGIKKYSSTEENNFFRGIACELQLGQNTSITAMSSYKKIDANIDEETNQILSFTSGGLHNTASTFSKRKNSNLFTNALRINLNTNNMKLGLNISSARLEHRIGAINSPSPYLEGEKEISVISADYISNLKTIMFFGEFAYNLNKSTAIINGCSFRPASFAKLSFLHRYYQDKYASLFSNAFSESSRISNEQGFYGAIELEPMRFFIIKGYFDFFSFPSPTYNNILPSAGSEYLLKVSYNRRKFNMYLKYKQQKKSISPAIYENKYKSPCVENKQYIRFHGEYRFNDFFSLKSRVELSEVKFAEKKEQGAMFYQDIKLRFEKMNIYFRYALFNTDSYASRIYTYENDLLYTFSVPSFYDRGQRLYIVVKKDFTDRICLWGKIATTVYDNKTEISSGSTLIKGKHKSDIGVQLIIKL